MRTAQTVGAEMKIVESVVDVNANRKKAMAQRVVAAWQGSVVGKTIALLGVTFKPNTDDMRESPSLDIVPALQKAGATVKAYDPAGMDDARTMLSDVQWCEDTYEVLDDADALVIVTEWNEFRSLDLERVRSLLKEPVIVDLRNIYDPEIMAEAGVRYSSIGRPDQVNAAESGRKAG